MVAYVASSPLVIAKTTDGSDTYVYHGQPIPENVSRDEIKRLVAGKFISRTSAEGEDESDEKSDEPASKK